MKAVVAFAVLAGLASGQYYRPSVAPVPVRAYARSHAAPITPVARSYATPVARSYAAPVARSYAAPVARSYAAPISRSYAAPISRSYAAPVTYSAPVAYSAPVSYAPVSYAPVSYAPVSYITSAPAPAPEEDDEYDQYEKDLEHWENWNTARFGLRQSNRDRDYIKRYQLGATMDVWDNWPGGNPVWPGGTPMGLNNLAYADAYMYLDDAYEDAIEFHHRYEDRDYEKLRDLEQGQEANRHRINSYNMWFLPGVDDFFGDVSFFRGRVVDTQRADDNYHYAREQYRDGKITDYDEVRSARDIRDIEYNEEQAELFGILPGINPIIGGLPWLKANNIQIDRAYEALDDARHEYRKDPSHANWRQKELAHLNIESAKRLRLVRYGTIFQNPLLNAIGWKLVSNSDEDYYDLYHDGLEDDYADAMDAGDYGYFARSHYDY